MRNIRRYVIVFILLSISLVLKFSSLGEKITVVDTFRGASIEKNIWNPLIAESVNEKKISVLVDSQEINVQDTGIFMDENLNLMLPVSLLRDTFGCSVHLYDNKEVLIEKRNTSVSFLLNEKSVWVNKEKNNIASSMVYKEGEYYVPTGVVSEFLNYSYEWDIEKNQAMAVNNAVGESIFPSKYDLRDKERASVMKDQGSFGTCWAFAALSAIESSLLPQEVTVFSPDHMSMRNSFFLRQADGGNYTMGMAYLTAWQGPVSEDLDPYGDNESSNGLLAEKHVQEIQIIDLKDYQKIKEAVFQYGGVQTSIYSALYSFEQDSDYYNSATASYCYLGYEKPNHDVVIIGWDDNYPKENFNMPLEGDGAFICQNSWGSDFGEDGIFYISYYDVNIGSHNLVYTKIEDTDNYDNIYQSDLCGWVGQVGYMKEDIYGANVYEAERDEVLKAAGFYAIGKEAEYELYVVKNFEGEASLSQKIPVAEGKLGNAGYYTINFEEPVEVAAGEQYAVILYILIPGSEKPMAIEFAADEFTSTVDLSDGQSYISSDSIEWQSLEETQQSNLCLKVYSNNK